MSSDASRNNSAISALSVAARFDKSIVSSPSVNNSSVGTENNSSGLFGCVSASFFDSLECLSGMIVEGSTSFTSISAKPSVAKSSCMLCWKASSITGSSSIVSNAKSEDKSLSAEMLSSFSPDEVSFFFLFLLNKLFRNPFALPVFADNSAFSGCFSSNCFSSDCFSSETFPRLRFSSFWRFFSSLLRCF